MAWAALSLGVSWLVSPRDAVAQAPAAASSCPAPPSETGPPGLDSPPSVETLISGAPGHWVATVQVRYESGVQGTREISARNCAVLQRAVAVTLSLLDGAQAAPPPASDATGASVAEAATDVPLEPFPSAPPPAVVASTAVPSGVPPSGSRAATPLPALQNSAKPGNSSAHDDHGSTAAWRRSSADDLEAFVRASSMLAAAGGRFGELGVALGYGMWFSTFGVRAELAARRPLSSLPAEHSVALQLQRYAVTIEPCARVRGSVDWALCGGPRLELLRGMAVGPSDPASDVVWLPEMSASGSLRVPLSASFALSTELRASWGLRAVRANVAPWGQVYELPRLGSALLLGGEWTL